MMKRAEPCGVNEIAIQTAPPGGEARAIVLFVSADADLRAVATRVLVREGYTVLTAAHAGHAILAGLTLDRIDVLISDVILDDMPGAALAERLRRHHPELRTLFMAEIGAAAADGLVVRPFTRDDLLLGLGALARSSPSPSISPAS
jgi:DNA-binding response OmpR family regulator